MIRYVTGDILDDDADALVNPVNCRGVMGAGLARQFKQRFPEDFAFYAGVCRQGGMKPGVVLVTDEAPIERCRAIVHFPTKDGWREPSRIEWIRDGLDDLRALIWEANFRSVAIPMLGCGLGGCRWADVRPLIEHHLGDLDCDVRVYGPPA